MIRVTTEDRTLLRDVESKALIAAPGAAQEWKRRQQMTELPLNWQTNQTEMAIKDLQKRIEDLEKKVEQLNGNSNNISN